MLAARGGGAGAEEGEEAKGKESYNDALRRFQAGLGAASAPRPNTLKDTGAQPWPCIQLSSLRPPNP